MFLRVKGSAVMENKLFMLNGTTSIINYPVFDIDDTKSRKGRFEGKKSHPIRLEWKVKGWGKFFGGGRDSWWATQKKEGNPSTVSWNCFTFNNTHVSYHVHVKNRKQLLTLSKCFR